MTTLPVIRTTVRTRPEDHLGPASAAGDEFTALPGGALLYARNKLKRRARTISLRVDYGSRVDDVSTSVAAGAEVIIGPFGLDIGGGLEAFNPGVPITVKLSYPRNRGLRVCVLEPPAPDFGPQPSVGHRDWPPGETEGS
jgi:hypothetical protein